MLADDRWPPMDYPGSSFYLEPREFPNMTTTCTVILWASDEAPQIHTRVLVDVVM